MASQFSNLHFVLIPLMAQGHMIPMIDMAKLFAERGVIVTIATTPLNAHRFKKIIDRAVESGLNIRVLQLRFPCQEMGLPEGCENLDIIPSRNLIRKFLMATRMLQKPLEKLLQQQPPLPSCIISDRCLSWTSEMALNFDIPRLVFHGMCCFSLLCTHNVQLYNVHENVTYETEPFIIPDLLHSIEVTKAQLPGAFVPSTDLDDLREQMKEAELMAYGVVVNSFTDLEVGYVEEYQKAIQKKVWSIGPVSLSNKKNLDKFERGNKASIDEIECLRWLDSREPRSVVYACLGSQCRLVTSQLIELGLGLEASNHPFIWVIKRGDGFLELEKWLNEGFEERIKGRGLLIKGWAPQLLILSHRSMGGFLTHCGWNSTLEGVCGGIPMLTWPLFAEQFFNEKLIVQVLGIGLRIGVDVPVRWGDEQKVGVLVKKEDVEKAINRLMEEGEEGEGRRKRARELGERARMSMSAEGTSYLNMTLLIKDIMHHVSQKQLAKDYNEV